MTDIETDAVERHIEANWHKGSEGGGWFFDNRSLLRALRAELDQVTGERDAALLASRYETDVAQQAMDARKAAQAEVERLREALTPSGATKAAYIGEVETDCPDGRRHAVSWTATKEIMALIRARAALETPHDDRT